MNTSIYEQTHGKMFILDHKVSKEFDLLISLCYYANCHSTKVGANV